jgi:hypothetical protein
MSREIGYSDGSSLNSFETGVQVAETLAREQANLKAERARQTFDSIRSGLEQSARRTERREAALASVNQERTVLVARRQEHPTDFSLPKGVLYLLLAVLLLAADFAILGQVVSQFLGLSWRDPSTLETFAQTFFRSPVAAFRRFPELMLLTLGILTLGMFFKVWRDAYLATQSAENRHALRRTEFRALTVFMVLSVACVVAMAFIRLLMPPGKTPDIDVPLTRWAAVLLGLSLPFISAAFFIKGYDLVGNVLLSGWLAVREAIAERRSDQAAAEHAKQLRSLETCRSELADIDSSDAIHARVVLARKQYEEGYAQGVADLLGDATTDGNLYPRLRPLALRMLFSNRRSQRA